MNILTKLTWRAMTKNRSRTLVTVIGVMLSAAMFMAITSIAASGIDYLRRGYAAENGDYYCRFENMDTAELEALSARPEVSEIGVLKAVGYFKILGSNDYMRQFVISACNPTYFQNMPIRLMEGRLPESSGEIVLDYDMLGSLKNADYPTQVGATLTIPVSNTPGREEDEEITTRSYLIVGLVKNLQPPVASGPDGLFPGNLYILDDGNQGEMLFCNAFVKTKPVKAILDVFEDGYGKQQVLQREYLNYLGVTVGAEGTIQLVYAAVGALCAIMMVSAVGLIYNAFSISLTERTKQFGLLSSIGATKKQLRRSALLEAAMVSLMGIPTGLLLGYGVSAVTVHFYGRSFARLFTMTDALESVTMRPVLSPMSMAVAALVSVGTVLLSAWLPARRATRITPMEAIRQTSGYYVGKRTPKAGILTQILQGFPGVLAKKYYKVSGKKYRSIVVSLTISILLFVSTLSLTGMFRDALISQAKYSTTDFSVYSVEHIPELRKQPFVTESALVDWQSPMGVILSENMYHPDYVKAWDKLFYSPYPGSIVYEPGIKNVEVQYLEDDAFRQLLGKNGIFDTEGYFDQENPKALVLTISGNCTFAGEKVDSLEFFSYANLPQLKGTVEQLTLLPSAYPSDLNPFQGAVRTDTTYLHDSKGQTIFQWTEILEVYRPGYGYGFEEGRKAWYLMKQETREGRSGIAYYHYDLETETAGDLAFFWAGEHLQEIALGAQVNGTPMGIHPGKYNVLALVRPLSTWPRAHYAELAIRVNDYQAALDYLHEVDADFHDYLEDEMFFRSIIATTQAAVTAFVVVVLTVCAANVFNTVSTSLALRRRDFGMLVSLGMEKRQLHRMLFFESLRYGAKALFWGLGIGMLIHTLVYRYVDGRIYIPYVFPWQILLMAVVAIILLVLASTVYALQKMKTNDPIEAIRQENL